MLLQIPQFVVRAVLLLRLKHRMSGVAQMDGRKDAPFRCVIHRWMLLFSLCRNENKLSVL